MSIIVPREYQDAAWRSIWEYYESGKRGNPLIAMPTGTGKTIIIALFILNVFKRYPGQRILVLSHVKELLEQDYNKLLDIWPGAPAGLYSSGLGRNDLGYPITVAGIASVNNKSNLFGHIDLILIDEAHLVSNKSTTMYRKFIDELLLINPNLKVIGLTATPYRLTTGMLTDPGGLFTDICFDLTNKQGFNWLLDQGYLVPVIPKPTKVALDLSDIPIVGNEFVQSRMQESIKKQDITYAALQEAIATAQYRKSWLTFSTGVEDAIETAEMLNFLGIDAKAVHSSTKKYRMPDDERDRIIAEFKNGDIQALVNNNMLTTGFDHPLIDLIIALRPTMSVSLWLQMVGRGTRPVYSNPGDHDLTTQAGRLLSISQSCKQNCLVLDYARNTSRLGPINDPVLPVRKNKKKGKGVARFEAPFKECDNCMEFVHASARICPNCEAPFEMEVKIDAFASTQALISRDFNDLEVPEIQYFDIDYITYDFHQKAGKTASLKVSYFSRTRSFMEFVCLEHEGVVRRIAVDWWKLHFAGDFIDMHIPSTIEDALSRTSLLKSVKRVGVVITDKYPKILEKEFGEPGSVASLSDGDRFKGPETGPVIEWDDDIPF